MNHVWLAAGIALSSFTASVSGETITLRFSGEISEIVTRGNPTFVLPSDINRGANATLDITFEPAPFPAAARQVGNFQSPGGSGILSSVHTKLFLGSHLFQDDGARVFTRHDPFSAQTGNSSPGVVPLEHIRLEASGSISFANAVLWNLSGGFANRGSVLDGGEDLALPNIWNRLPLRTISTRFEGNGLGHIDVYAQLGDAVLVVPEPSAMCAFIAIATGVAVSLLPRRR